MSEAELQCYNISCGKKYLESENNDEACVYHEGKPYFHDGYKEWTCCKLRSRDFTIFMGFKGCTKGRHSNVKIEEPKPEVVPDTAPSNTGDSNGTTQVEAAPFVPPDSKLVESIVIHESANLASAPPIQNIIICKNCKSEESTIDLDSECLYHRGIQIFHDSLKYWSCCPQKKFTEFEEFQKLPPCAKSNKHELMMKVDCKENWFQTGNTLTIALYGLRGARLREGKSMATIRGGRQLCLHLVNSNSITIFEKQWLLKDYVLAEKCKVTLNASNVQIVLHKANDKVFWSDLVAKLTDLHT